MMLRDELTIQIQTYLDNLIKDPDGMLKYESILTLANHALNLLISADDHNKHSVVWYNRNINSTHDEDVQTLFNYIKDLESKQ